MNDLKLQLTLAKMLPKHIEVIENFTDGEPDIPTHSIQWRRAGWTPITDTEWLYVCWLIECAMTEAEHYLLFTKALSELSWDNKLTRHTRDYITAPWQLRAQAILKAKGVEL